MIGLVFAATVQKFTRGKELFHTKARKDRRLGLQSGQGLQCAKQKCWTYVFNREKLLIDRTAILKDFYVEK